MVMLVAGAKSPASQIEQQQGQPHRQLGKEIVKCRGEGKLQTVVKQRARHIGPMLWEGCREGSCPIRVCRRSREGLTDTLSRLHGPQDWTSSAPVGRMATREDLSQMQTIDW